MNENWNIILNVDNRSEPNCPYQQGLEDRDGGSFTILCIHAKNKAPAWKCSKSTCPLRVEPIKRHSFFVSDEKVKMEFLVPVKLSFEFVETILQKKKELSL